MTRLRLLHLALCSSLLLCSAALARAQAYTTIVVFGDSLSDTGNFAHLSASAYGVRIPGPVADYTDGRFTSGTDTVPQALLYSGVWIEQLAATFTAKPTVKDSLDGGTNYAYGSATNSSGTQVVMYGTGNALSVTVKNVGQQIADYLATKPTITNKTLFVVWCGANDLLAATTSAAIVAAANLDVANVQTLINAGATDFIIPNLPPLGAIPRLNANAATAAPATAAAQAYNATIAAGIAALPAANTGKTLHLYLLDNYSLFNSILATPSVFGFTNVTQMSQAAAVNPDAYLFWDDLHPTVVGHHFLAVNARNVLNATAAASEAVTLSTASALAGQTITLSATVAATATGTQPVPTGYVTFYSGSTAVATATLNSSGTATATMLAGTATGSPYSITAQYSGDTTYLGGTSSAKTLTVPALPVMTTTTLASSANNVNLASSVTFTATLTAVAGIPTGTVTFLDGTTTLGTGTLTVGATSSTATYTTSALTAGTHSITATLGASTTYASSTSTAVSEVVVAPAVTLTGLTTTFNVLDGGTGTESLFLTGVGGLAGTYTLSCGSVPAHVSCSFSPATLSVSAASNVATSSLMLSTTAAQLSAPRLPGRFADPQIVSAFLFLPCLGGLTWLRRRRSDLRGLPLLVLMLLLSGGPLLGLTGCGSSSSNKAADGTYPLVVTATPASSTSGSAVTTTLNLVIQ